jgi:cellulose synthase (UDP-forming)
MDNYTNNEIIRAKAPLKPEIRIIRLLICCGIIFMLIFLKWFIDPEHIGYAPIFWLLTFALVFKLAKMLHEWYHYWSLSVPERPTVTKQWTVDVLTTACPGEPREMIIRTLKAMKDITYPHTNYLCDEGDDPEYKKICKELGIVHVTRIIKVDAKAGNINNALKQATGELCVVLDPDHVPIPEFLDRVIPYFEDERIGYVQCVQAYGNQSESFIARGAAEQTYHFYGPMMMCMNTYGTVQAIGANCTFRRSALDSIGGHAAGLAEDMHTAMQLHAKGWRSVYVPEILSRGLVPATLSSYYKQQLKWSRGTFELLFRTFPHLYKNFTWRQKLHYFCIPIYFLFGLINLIDIAIPVIALGLAEVPWEVDVMQFGLFFLPVCSISLIIRLYSQRWLLEKHERGFHFAGGILRTATWWIFLVGFIYSIFNIKVPYIPTPKEDEHQNYIKLSIPNFLILITCCSFVIYGLYLDWSPYTMVMGFYSVITGGMLGFTVLMSQQKFILQANRFCTEVPLLQTLVNWSGYLFERIQLLIYNVVRKGAIVLISVLSLVFLSSIDVLDTKDENSVREKELGTFYFGTSGANITTNVPFNLISYEQDFGNEKEILPFDQIKEQNEKGILPFVSWQTDRLETKCKEKLYSGIISGQYDPYLKKCAELIREYKDPVFLNFKTIEGNENSAESFVKAWQYLYTFFNELGISNITWVWCPANAGEENFYPGEKFVDWIGVSCLNYADRPAKKDWYSFSEIYKPYRKAFGKFEKPVMITAFGSSAGPNQLKWFKDAFTDIQNNYKEIRSVILFDKVKEFSFWHDIITYKTCFNLYNYQTADFINQSLQTENFNCEKLVNKNYNTSRSDYSSAFVKGSPGKFQLLVNGQPYYIRGVAYNTAHDWRDGNMPLTRRQVEKDFARIKEMGANTIRRYGTGLYDRNVLNIAEEYGLNVLYGFWFDPKIDFYRDSVKVNNYIEEVIEKVQKYKDHSSIIAWSLGNESWGLLKHTFAKPYLTEVRNAYINMIEHLAQRIHIIDPTRPVFSCIEHEEYQLAGELVAFHDGAPSIDVIGVNSYYKEQISKLNHLTWQFDSLRPYLVSEFGPRGYWDPKYNTTENGSIIEETDSEKSNWYKKQWVNYVAGYKGYNVGGFAYCWHDRMEGTYTWFGLTDYKGRVKPAYYALKEQWTKIKDEPLPQFTISYPAKLLPGKKCYFEAKSNFSKDNLHYDWRLLKDEYLDKVDNIESSETLAEVTIPEEPADYRLYLFVTDKQNQRVTTASVPIKVPKKNRQ